MNVLEFIIQLPKMMLNLFGTIFNFASQDIPIPGLGSVSIFAILSGGLVAIILTVKIIQWFISGG